MHGRSGKEQHRGFNCSGEVAGWIRAQSEARLAAIDASEECDLLILSAHHAGAYSVQLCTRAFTYRQIENDTEHAAVCVVTVREWTD